MAPTLSGFPDWHFLARIFPSFDVDIRLDNRRVDYLDGEDDGADDPDQGDDDDGSKHFIRPLVPPRWLSRSPASNRQMTSTQNFSIVRNVRSVHKLHVNRQV